MTRSLKAFGENVRNRRKSLGMTQEALAYTIKRDTRSVVAIESGNRNTTLKTLEKICTALKTKASNLLPF